MSSHRLCLCVIALLGCVAAFALSRSRSVAPGETASVLQLPGKLEAFEGEARAGNATAMHALGQLALGTRVKRLHTNDLAFRWSRPSDQSGIGWIDQAAKCGVVGAMREAAELRLVGAPSLHDVDTAKDFLLAATDQGDVGSMLRLSELQRDGAFGAPDMPEATRWALLAADRGCWEAMVDLAGWSIDGTGGAVDWTRARAWIQRAIQIAPRSETSKLEQKLREISMFEASAEHPRYEDDLDGDLEDD